MISKLPSLPLFPYHLERQEPQGSPAQGNGKSIKGVFHRPILHAPMHPSIGDDQHRNMLVLLSSTICFKNTEYRVSSKYRELCNRAILLTTKKHVYSYGGHKR